MIVEIWENKEKGLYRGYIIKDFERLRVFDGKFYLRFKGGVMSGSIDKLKTFTREFTDALSDL